MLRVVASTFSLVMVLVAVFELASAAQGREDRLLLLADAYLSVVCGLGAWAAAIVVQRGQYTWAAWLLIGSLAVKAALTALISPAVYFGVLAPLYLVPIVMSQVLLGSWPAVGVAGGATVMFAVAYWTFPGDPADNTVPLVASACLLLYALVFTLLHVTLTQMREALRKADQMLISAERARADLREREEQFRALGESSATGIVIQQDGHLVYANPHFVEMVHAPRGDVFGLSLWDFFDEEARQALQVQLARRRSLVRGMVAPEQLLFRPLKGQPRWCQVAVAEAEYWGKPAVVANLLDVTELVEAQMQVRRERDFSDNIISTADAIIMVLDAEARVVLINSTGEELTGYSLEELKGRPFWEQFTAAERMEETAQMVQAMRTQRRGEAETTWQNRAGDDLIIAWRWVAESGPDGAITGYVVIGLDVTQQRLLERQATVTERLRSLGEIAGGVAHDLNNMLAGIVGPADLMLMDETDPEKERSLEAIMSAAKRGAETVRRIQRFAQARTELDRQDFDLRQLTEDVIFTLRPRWRDAAQRQGLVINVINEVPERIKVHASSGEMGNVLTNLIVNACEAMPEGGTIRVTGSATEDTVEFCVSDNGIGMSEETQAQIFQPFFSTKGADNSGLGLAVIRGIILRHGGTIEVESELGVGTTFRITLPAARELDDQPAIARDEEKPMDKMKVLIVDDMDDIRDYMSRAMNRLGHEATVASTGEEAIQQLQHNHFDVLVTDYGMEHISGPDLAERARTLQPHIQCVLITGWDVDVSDFHGFVAVLQKPFTRDQIREALARAEAAVAAG